MQLDQETDVKRYCRIEVSDLLRRVPRPWVAPTRLRLASLSAAGPRSDHICFISSWLGYLSKSSVLQEQATLDKHAHQFVFTPIQFGNDKDLLHSHYRVL